MQKKICLTYSMVKKIRKIVLFAFIFSQMSYVYFFQVPQYIPGETAGFTNASDTLSNSRLSYRAGVATGTSGSSVVTIDASGNADNDTTHLFPKDTLCFGNSALSGCIGSKTYNVANVIDGTTFNINEPLSNNLDTSGYAIASQSAVHTIVFTLANSVPSNGDILITIPAVDANTVTNDSFPDTNSSIATNGFDLNGLSATDVSVSSSGCANDWNATETITAGGASSDHTIRIDRTTSSCAAGATITVTVGGTKKLINPAPISTGHTKGTADIYTINVKTRDGSDFTIDQSNIKVAVIEGVLVSATVQETLSVAVAGVSSSTSACGQTTSVTTTATSVPWGVISSFGSFLNAAQTVTVSTNAGSGYVVKAEENDQMGKDGVACSGPNANASNSCIQDTVCNGTGCTESTSQDWTSGTFYGLGYSLANVSGTDAAFTYNESSRTFSSKQFADQEASEAKQTIMSKNAPVESSQAYLCYRLSVPAIQPAGYYYNRVQLTATATF